MNQSTSARISKNFQKFFVCPEALLLECSGCFRPLRWRYKSWCGCWIALPPCGVQRCSDTQDIVPSLVLFIFRMCNCRSLLASFCHVFLSPSPQLCLEMATSLFLVASLKNSWLHQCKVFKKQLGPLVKTETAPVACAGLRSTVSQITCLPHTQNAPVRPEFSFCSGSSCLRSCQ